MRNSPQPQTHCIFYVACLLALGLPALTADAAPLAGKAAARPAAPAGKKTSGADLFNRRLQKADEYKPPRPVAPRRRRKKPKKDEDATPVKPPVAKPPAAKPAVTTAPPVPRFSEMVVTGARKWLEGERQAFGEIPARVQRLVPPRPDIVTDPRPIPSQEAEIVRRDRGILELVVVGEDGRRLRAAEDPEGLAPNVLRALIVPGTAPPLQYLTATGYTVDFGLRKPLTMTLEPNAGWELVGVEPKKALPLNWSRAVTEVQGVDPTTPSKPVRPAALFLSRAARDRAAAQEAEAVRLKAPPALEKGTYPQPATALQHGLEYVKQAQEMLEREILAVLAFSDPAVSVRPAGTEEDRYTSWERLEQAQALLALAEADLVRCEEEAAALTTLRDNKDGLRAILRADYWDGLTEYPQHVTLTRFRLGQLRAACLWWQAQVENPLAPDRKPALEVLDGLKAAGPQQEEELRLLNARYQSVARKEASLARRIADGEFDQKRAFIRHTEYRLRMELKVRPR